MKKKIRTNKRWTLAWFKEWIVLNNLESIIEQDKKRETVFYFKNVTRQLEIWIRYSDIVIAPMYRKYCFDMLRCIDIYPAKSDKGYYCEECTDKPVKYYSSLKELFINHSFNELLEWYKEKIVPGNSIYLMRLRDGGATWAKLTTEEGLIDDKENILKTIPLFIKK